MRLTDNFTLDEMTFSSTAIRLGIDNTPSKEHINNLIRLCVTLEDVRDACNAPIKVTSGYRCKALNDAIKGSRNSQHMIGCAADIRCNSYSIGELIDIIQEAKIEYDQLIMEFDSWVHISVPSKIDAKPRKQALVIDKFGTRAFS